MGKKFTSNSKDSDLVLSNRVTYHAGIPLLEEGPASPTA